MDVRQSYRVVRILLALFMFGLLVSGLTAFPLLFEINILERLIGKGSFMLTIWPAMANWISFVYRGLHEVNNQYPFMFYGTDWLAFAHITIAVFFIGPFRDPIRNIWVIQAGMIACILLIPLALVCGSIRGLPSFWIVIDCSFGVFGIIPLVIAYRVTRRIRLAETG